MINKDKCERMKAEHNTFPCQDSGGVQQIVG